MKVRIEGGSKPNRTLHAVLASFLRKNEAEAYGGDPGWIEKIEWAGKAKM